MHDSISQFPSTWVSNAVEQQATGGCQLIGMTSGNRSLNDTRTIVSLARQLTAAANAATDSRVLLCRLNVFPSQQVERLDEQSSGLPAATRSPLGAWKEVTVPVPIGTMASWSLLQLPSWLATWRTAFGFVLVDIGPVSLVPARVIGRLCNANYLVLGPQSSGSHDWLLGHVDWLRDSGVNVAGTLLASHVLSQKAA